MSDTGRGAVASGGGVLRELAVAAAVKRAARRRVADVIALGAAPLEVASHRRAHEVATARWVTLIGAAAADGYPVAVIARAAGVTPASVRYRLSGPRLISAGRPVVAGVLDGGDIGGGEVGAKPKETHRMPNTSVVSPATARSVAGPR